MVSPSGHLVYSCPVNAFFREAWFLPKGKDENGENSKEKRIYPFGHLMSLCRCDRIPYLNYKFLLFTVSIKLSTHSRIFWG